MNGRSRTFTLALSLMIVLGITGLAIARQQGLLVPVGEEGTYFVLADNGMASVWQETNGNVHDGLFANADGTGATGIQAHDVCYGTFTEHDVRHINEHIGYTVFGYVPWTQGPKACKDAGGNFVQADTLVFGEMPDYAFEH